MESKFSLGHTVITANAQNTLHPEDVVHSLARHAAGDWGDVNEDDKELNERGVIDGDRLMSAYTDRDQTKFWIITEADRSVTTVLLPEDY